MGTLEGQTALVTGASRGIGLAIAQSLVARGARVVLTARKPEALAEAVELLGGPEVAVAVPGHASDVEHRAAAVRTAVETFGSLDMLVGNVGVNPVYGPMMDLDLDAFRKILDTNVVSALGLVQEAWRADGRARGLGGDGPLRARLCAEARDVLSERPESRRAAEAEDCRRQ